jgi:HK97 family phage prohead protease
MNKLSFGFDVKAKEKEGSIVIAGYANANTIDRCKERIDPSAWNLDNYKKNPVVLFDHGHDPSFGNLPIGKARMVKASDGGLYCEVEISNSKTERITAIRDLIEEGILKTFSVGFDPKTAEKEGDIAVIKDAELIEISAVPLPMNQDSTFSLMSRSLSDNRTKAAKKWFNNYKKKAQAEIIKSHKDEIGTEKIEIVSIVVRTSDEMNTLEKTSKFLKSFGYKVDQCEATELGWKFMQSSHEGKDISIKIHPDIEIFVKAEENACGKKPDKKEDDEEMMEGEPKPMDKIEDKPKEGEEKPKEDEELKEDKPKEFGKIDEEAWGKAKEAANENYSPDDGEKYWAVVALMYMNKLSGTTEQESSEPEKSIGEIDTKSEVPGDVIPTGPNAVRGDSNPMIDLQKQTNILIAGVISELQKISMMIVETPEPEDEVIEPVAPMPDEQSSIDIQKSIEKIRKTQQDLNMRLKKLI